jgi:hypothetical protein
MKALNVRYLERRLLADGKVAFYYVPPKAARKAKILDAVPLGTDPVKAVARAEELNKILDGWRMKTAPTDAESVKGTVSWLAKEFTKHDWYIAVEASTRAFYDHNLKILKEFKLKSGRKLGDVMASHLEPRHVDAIYLSLKDIDPADPEKKPRTLPKANAAMRTARRLFNVGKRLGVVKDNPFAKMNLTGSPEREVVWQPDQLDAFVDAAIDAGRPSLGLAAILCRELCQREGDVLGLTWNRYKADGTMMIRQGKTNTLVAVPVSDELRQMLDATPRRKGVPDNEDFIVISEPTETQYKARYFAQCVSEVRIAANLPADLWIMDLRRTGLTELGDAGGTEDEIMSVSGHLSRDVVRRYVRKTRAQAINAIQKRATYRQQKKAAGQTQSPNDVQTAVQMATTENLENP